MKRNLTGRAPLLGVLLAVCLIALPGCMRVKVVPPAPVMFAQLNTIIVSADDLCANYMADKDAADALYTGKNIWITDAVVNACASSSEGNSMQMKWFQPAPVILINSAVITPSPFACSSLRLDAQKYPGFKDVGDGYFVQVFGECQGITDGIINIKINVVEKAGIPSTAVDPSW